MSVSTITYHSKDYPVQGVQVTATLQGNPNIWPTWCNGFVQIVITLNSADSGTSNYGLVFMPTGEKINVGDYLTVTYASDGTTVQSVQLVRKSFFESTYVVG